jgi:hypothetical protein
MLPVFEDEVMNAEWHCVLSFIEFFHKEFLAPSQLSDQVVRSINDVFRQRNAQFRIIDGLVTPDPGEIESEAIEEALKPPSKRYSTIYDVRSSF